VLDAAPAPQNALTALVLGSEIVVGSPRLLDLTLGGGDERVRLPEVVAQEVDQIADLGAEVVLGCSFR